MSDNYLDGAVLGIVGLGLFSVSQSMYAMSDYQRQQLNLLRQHKGLPPIAPPPAPIDFFYLVICLTVRFMIAVTATVGFWVMYGDEYETTNFETFGGIGLGLAIFIALTRRATNRRAAEYRYQLQQWADAGCP